MPTTTSEKPQITISPDTLKALREIAAKQNISLSDALQQAINVGHLLVDAGKNQNTHILLKTGNKIQELKLRSGTRD